MTFSTPFTPLKLTFTEYRSWLFSLLFVGGNLLLPQLCHLIPQGGFIFLPIYFFTLIAAYKFGMRVGLLTAVLSPVMNHLLFGMPPLGVMPVLLTKSVLLAIAAGYTAQHTLKLSVLNLLLVVLTYQVLGGIFEGILNHNVLAGLQDFRMGVPGMALQILGGWMVLRMLSRYER